MELVSYVVLILLTIFSYSMGIVGKSGKAIGPKPQTIDLIVILVIWAGAIYSRTTLDLNKWLLILIWVGISALIGTLSARFHTSYGEKDIGEDSGSKSQKTSKNPFVKIWRKWGVFSSRVGGFQSRMTLSFFFFLIVTPFALGVKTFSDPLRIKDPGNGSYWLSKAETKIDLAQFRKQF